LFNKNNINGIAHIALNVLNLNKSKKFYDKILPYFGLKLFHQSNKSFYYIGGKTGILIQQLPNIKSNNLKFSQNNIGLHHFCFRMRSKNAIDNLHIHLKKNNIKIIRGPINGSWVPGYYYILFEDPDKIRIEANFVPSKGVFNDGVKFNPSNDY